MIDLILVAKTVVEWDTLLPSAKHALGRSVSLSLDSAAWPVAGIPGWIACVAELAEAGRQPKDVLRNDKHALAHAFLSFIAVAPTRAIFKVSQLGLHVTPAPEDLAEGQVAIISGTLAQWHACIIQGLRKDAKPEVKELLCKALARLEREGLKEVFADSKKQHTKDGFYYLTPKET